jgi:hypothetical protein
MPWLFWNYEPLRKRCESPVSPFCTFLRVRFIETIQRIESCDTRIGSAELFPYTLCRTSTSTWTLTWRISVRIRQSRLFRLVILTVLVSYRSFAVLVVEFRICLPANAWIGSFEYGNMWVSIQIWYVTVSFVVLVLQFLSNFGGLTRSMRHSDHWYKSCNVVTRLVTLLGLEVLSIASVVFPSKISYFNYTICNRSISWKKKAVFFQLFYADSSDGPKSSQPCGTVSGRGSCSWKNKEEGGGVTLEFGRFATFLCRFFWGTKIVAAILHLDQWCRKLLVKEQEELAVCCNFSVQILLMDQNCRIHVALGSVVAEVEHFRHFASFLCISFGGSKLSHTALRPLV